MATSWSVRAGAMVAQAEIVLSDYARPGAHFVECISSCSGTNSTSTSKPLQRFSCAGRFPNSVAFVPVRSRLGYVGASQNSSRAGARPRAASGSVQQEEIAAVGTMSVGQFLVQGLREEMEDEIAVDVDAPHGFSYAAIFDGHAGDFAAKWLRSVISPLPPPRLSVAIT